MAIIGREVIGKKHGKTKEIHVPEWDGSILIRQLSHQEVVTIQGMAADALDAATQTIKDRSKLTKFNFELIRLSWVDADGDPVLTSEKEDYDWLVSEPNAVIKALTDEMSLFSGLRDEAAKDAEKNSLTTLNGASGSGSRSPSVAVR